MTRSIIVFPQARSDIRCKAKWLRENMSTSTADRWNSAIVAKIATLANNAQRWTEADETASLNRNLRCLIFGRGRHMYRILFTIDGQTVNVHRVRHAAEDWLSDDDL